jgi:hypothetical protein
MSLGVKQYKTQNHDASGKKRRTSQKKENVFSKHKDRPDSCVQNVSESMSISAHVEYLTKTFDMKGVFSALTMCAARSPYFASSELMKRGLLGGIGKTAGGISLCSMLFLVDMTRIGMAEIYSCARIHRLDLAESYERLCGNARPSERAWMVAPLLLYFCETMLFMRGRVRFDNQLATYICKYMMNSDMVLRVMHRNGIEGARDILHFCGISMYEMLMVADADVVFQKPRERGLLVEQQLHRFAQTVMRRLAPEDAVERMSHTLLNGRMDSELLGTVDVWGNDGPDMMEHALSLYGTMTACGGGERPAVTDGDLSSVMF